jgi:hypothetical protein
LPLQIETEVFFEGVLFGRRTEEECRKLIEPFLPEEEFQYVQNKYGVSLLIPNSERSITSNYLVLGDY